MATIPTIDSESIQAGLAAAPPFATIDVWQSMDPTVPFSLQNWGISNFQGVHNQIGLHNGIGAHILTGVSSLLGIKLGVGGQVNAEPKNINSAFNYNLNSLDGNLRGDWKYRGDQICAPCPSDARSKLNVTTLEKSLDKVKKLRGVSFNWNPEVVPRRAETGKTSIGLIAQEVEEVVPEVVVEETIENQRLKTVEYANLTALLIEAIKEQQNQIDELKQTVQQLSTKLASRCKTC